MKINQQTGVIATITATLLSIQIFSLNEFSLGLAVMLLIELIIIGLLFSSKKIGWWMFSITFDLLSVLMVLHVFIMNNSGLKNSLVTALIALTTWLIILHRPTRRYYLKK
tara:strand:+ start:526 stop:855 length:330 start_codon:yes stop_codon:yes gene_type:complete